MSLKVWREVVALGGERSQQDAFAQLPHQKPEGQRSRHASRLPPAEQCDRGGPVALRYGFPSAQRRSSSQQR